MSSRPKRKKTRKADGRFARFVSSGSLANDALPLVHITRAYHFDEILSGQTLDPHFCRVFKRKLTYLFYGRPAYRAKEGNNARLEFEWPIIFLFDPAKVKGIWAIYPFDTGAFDMGLYRSFFDKSATVSDFELPPVIDSAQQMVGTFYSNNREYYTGLSRKNVDLPPRSFEAQGVHELARLPGMQDILLPDRNVRDERSSAIEVQVVEPIRLAETLLGVVLPQIYLDDDEIMAALARWNVTNVETYTTIQGIGAEGWVGQVYLLVQRLYERLGYLR